MMTANGHTGTETCVALSHAHREYPRGPVPSVHIITFREGKVLLVRRVHAPGAGNWSIPGGVIELGETLQHAGQRELHEECGIQVEIRRVLNVVDNIVFDESKHIRFHYIVIYLLAQYLGGEARPGSDASEVRWIVPEELGTLNMHPLARQAVQQAFTMA